MFGELTEGVRLLGGVMFINPVLTKTRAGLTDGWISASVPQTQLNLGGRMGRALRAWPDPEWPGDLYRLAIHRHDLAASQSAGMDALRSRPALHLRQYDESPPVSRSRSASLSRTFSMPATGRAAAAPAPQPSARPGPSASR